MEDEAGTCSNGRRREQPCLSEETGMWIVDTIKERQEQMSPLQDLGCDAYNLSHEQVQ